MQTYTHIRIKMLEDGRSKLLKLLPIALDDTNRKVMLSQIDRFELRLEQLYKSIALNNKNYINCKSSSVA